MTHVGNKLCLGLRRLLEQAVGLLYVSQSATKLLEGGIAGLVVDQSGYSNPQDGCVVGKHPGPWSLQELHLIAGEEHLHEDQHHPLCEHNE